ncbi:hypothetical protein CC80DRAFT_550635 [Byssothecium circinans]|uniref:Uncharacterized protein n=1 Tax=Byssothecium circinans TaxID=147558 RepID=A0A6A5TZ08_9PLEO|nr:hypothetical protein CC80DRAFT_550635 [Byssothecium circinans]
MSPATPKNNSTKPAAAQPTTKPRPNLRDASLGPKPTSQTPSQSSTKNVQFASKNSSKVTAAKSQPATLSRSGSKQIDSDDKNATLMAAAKRAEEKEAAETKARDQAEARKDLHELHEKARHEKLQRPRGKDLKERNTRDAEKSQLPRDIARFVLMCPPFRRFESPDTAHYLSGRANETVVLRKILKSLDNMKKMESQVKKTKSRLARVTNEDVDQQYEELAEAKQFLIEGRDREVEVIEGIRLLLDRLYARHWADKQTMGNPMLCESPESLPEEYAKCRGLLKEVNMLQKEDFLRSGTILKAVELFEEILEM